MYGYRQTTLDRYGYGNRYGSRTYGYGYGESSYRPTRMRSVTRTPKFGTSKKESKYKFPKSIGTGIKVIPISGEKKHTTKHGSFRTEVSRYW